MHGDGISPAITTGNMSRPRLLDLTRSLRRAGRMLTGVDRVELAYLERFCAEPEPVFGVVRTPFGYLLLDQAGVAAFGEKLKGGQSWGAISLLSRLGGKRSNTVRQAESDLRRLCIARAQPKFLGAMIRRIGPCGFDYYNVGHSNLTKRMLGAVKGSGGKVHVLVHDVIPLDYPEFQRQGTVQAFREKMWNVKAHADCLIFNSKDTSQRALHYLENEENPAEEIVAHLGTMIPAPDPTGLPADLPPKTPYFVVVGTIEPRKNHGFLLDVWNDLGPDAPPLLICGSRGWNNDEVFARLDARPAQSPIREVPNLDDAALAYLVQNSAGMLFPSVAEGFGLPPVEALSLGARVLCNDLPVLHEFLGEKAVYASVNERYLWLDTITSWAKSPPTAQEIEPFSGPNWDDHFKTVLRLR